MTMTIRQYVIRNGFWNGLSIAFRAGETLWFIKILITGKV